MKASPTPVAAARQHEQHASKPRFEIHCVEIHCVDIYESATDVEAKEVLPAGW